MKWKKIIAYPENRDLFKKLSEIHGCIVNNFENIKSNNIGLLGGKIETAIFLYYYSKLINKKESADQVYEFLIDS
jgi:4-hydroxy-3-methylbut-2-en-1-yl diphosphate synthase IspG/GcpE